MASRRAGKQREEDDSSSSSDSSGFLATEREDQRGNEETEKTNRRKQPAPVKRGEKQIPTPVQNRRPSRRGMAAIREMRKYQKSTNLLIPKLPFSRLVKEVAIRVASNSMQDLRSNKQYNSLNKTRETNGFALGSRQLPSWLFKRLRKRTSPPCSRTPCSAPFTPRGSPSCPRTFSSLKGLGVALLVCSSGVLLRSWLWCARNWEIPALYELEYCTIWGRVDTETDFRNHLNTIRKNTNLCTLVQSLCPIVFVVYFFYSEEGEGYVFTNKILYSSLLFGENAPLMNQNSLELFSTKGSLLNQQ